MFWKFFKAECGLVWQVSIPGNPDVRSSELTHKQAYRRYAEGTWRKKKKKKKSRALPRWRTAQSSAHSLQHSLIQDKSLRLMLMGEGRKPLPTRALASQGLLFWGRGRSKYGLPKGGGRNSLGAGSWTNTNQGSAREEQKTHPPRPPRFRERLATMQGGDATLRKTHSKIQKHRSCLRLNLDQQNWKPPLLPHRELGTK